MSNQQEEYDPTCKQNCLLLMKDIWVGFANFFECDQRFESFEIVPYEINSIKDQHTLLGVNESSRQDFSKQIQDIMLLEHDESSRWGQLLTWKWWKAFICCLPDDNMEFEQKTDYDFEEGKMFDEEVEKDQKENDIPKSVDVDKANNKDNVVYIDQQFFDGDHKGNLHSAFSQMNNDSIVELRPVAQRVHPKDEILPVKRKNKRRQYRQQIVQNDQVIINSTPAQSDLAIQQAEQKQQERTEVIIQETEDIIKDTEIVNIKQQPVIIHENLQEQNLPQQNLQEAQPQVKPESQEVFQIKDQYQQPLRQLVKQIENKNESGFSIDITSKNMRKSSQDIIYESPRSPVRPPKRRQKQHFHIQSNINAQDEFSQLELNIEKAGEKQLGHSKTTVQGMKIQQINRQYQNNIEMNQSEVQFQKNPNFFNERQQPNSFIEPSFQQTESYLEDTRRKKKRKGINLFEQQADAPGVDLQVIEQMPPEDSAVKKRRKRRKTILNEQKKQQQRAQKRKNEELQKDQQDLEVIIYSEGEDDN